ncbi:hypothetical protein FB451DRAFT_1571618, partial [Mycena latifolia]
MSHFSPDMVAVDRSAFLKDSHRRDDSKIFDIGDTLIDSKSAREARKGSRSQSSKALRFFSFVLHGVLAAIHIALVVVWSRSIEHRLVFSLDQQRNASLLITVITTTFGTLYTTLLVFVTQTLSTRRSLRMNQTLTATHDTAAAWGGIGSAFIHVWHQTVVRASLFGVLSTLMYLGAILVLHITTPALFSVQTFTIPHDIPVGTRSNIPVYNWSIAANSTVAPVLTDMDNILTSYLPGSLSFLPSTLGDTMSPGLYEGTLYDLLNSNEGIGDGRVNATGFNITCGYPAQEWLAGIDSGMASSSWHVSGGGSLYSLPATQPGVISALKNKDGFVYPLTLYSTIQIVDSSDNHPPLLDISPAMNGSVSYIQVLQCVQTLVTQTAVVDAQTGHIRGVEPDIKKTQSTWSPYAGPVDTPGAWLDRDPRNTTSGNLFLDLWYLWYCNMPATTFDIISSIGDMVNAPTTAADMYLVETLNLHPDNSTYDPDRTVTLHEVENALSTLVASMFWTLGNVPPTLGHIDWPEDSFSTHVPYSQITDEWTSPVLFQGSGTVTEVSTQGRLNASIIAIAVGLAASIALFLLSLPSVIFRTDTYSDEASIDGTGTLQAIWLYRNQSELERILPQVENPTTDNLREAGMIRTRLLDSRSPVSAAPWKELPAKDQSSGLFQTRDNAEDALLNPGTTLFRPSREVQNKSRFHSSKALRSVSLFMHSTLIAIHLILAALWSKGIEHRLIFSLAHQSTVALLITAITTAFGTLYSALLVLVTQTKRWAPEDSEISCSFQTPPERGPITFWTSTK